MVRDTTVIKGEKFFNTVELVGILLTLFMAFAFQLLLNELPCPLCLLQRVGFLGIAFGLMLNLRFGFRPSHYAVTLLSTLFTSFIALRQIALHVVPGTGSYGSAIFGLHLYTWSFILCMLIMIATIIMLGVDRQYKKVMETKHRWLTQILFLILVLLIVANIFSVYMICGVGACPDNPINF